MLFCAAVVGCCCDQSSRQVYKFAFFHSLSFAVGKKLCRLLMATNNNNYVKTDSSRRLESVFSAKLALRSRSSHFRSPISNKQAKKFPLVST